MKRVKLGWVGLVAGLAVLLVAGPLFALQHEKVEPKELVKLMEASKMTLVTAIANAEKDTKGVAIRAIAEKTQDGLRFYVQCVVGDTIKAVQVDQTGKVTPAKAPGEKGEGHKKSEGDKAGKEKKDKGAEPKKP